jgi:hypothetical protein
MFNPFVTACHLRDAMRNGKIYFAFTERKRETDSYIFRVCTERKKKLVMKGLIVRILFFKFIEGDQIILECSLQK